MFVSHSLEGTERTLDPCIGQLPSRLQTKDDTIDMDDVAILAQAEGIEPVTTDGDRSDQVRSLIENDVTVKACSNTLDMFDLSEADLIGGVEVVSSGVGELTRLQNDGYAYIST